MLDGSPAAASSIRSACVRSGEPAAGGRRVAQGGRGPAQTVYELLPHRILHRMRHPRRVWRPPPRAAQPAAADRRCACACRFLRYVSEHLGANAEAVLEGVPSAPRPCPLPREYRASALTAAARACVAGLLEHGRLRVGQMVSRAVVRAVESAPQRAAAHRAVCLRPGAAGSRWQRRKRRTSRRHRARCVCSAGSRPSCGARLSLRRLGHACSGSVPH